MGFTDLLTDAGLTGMLPASVEDPKQERKSRSQTDLTQRLTAG